MAYTATVLRQTVYGNERVIHYSVVADAASGAVSTGLGFIDQAHVTPQSLTTAIFKLKLNTNAASAAANGTVFISSIASGDTFFLTVYGR